VDDAKNSNADDLWRVLLGLAAFLAIMPQSVHGMLEAACSGGF